MQTQKSSSWAISEMHVRHFCCVEKQIRAVEPLLRVMWCDACLQPVKSNGDCSLLCTTLLLQQSVGWQGYGIAICARLTGVSI